MRRCSAGPWSPGTLFFRSVRGPALLLLCVHPGSALGTGDDGASVDFARDVRPILAENCFLCHGLDATERQAGLRLDIQQAAFGELPSGRRAVVAGDPEASALVQRVTASDVDERMPPLDSGKALSQEQVELLGRWVAQGAEWMQHWSFVPPARPTPPTARDVSEDTPAIDRFILARLQDEGLEPRAVASREVLLRRVTYDLTGLPPTVEERESFLGDESDGAYGALVERLLASPRYGEHRARYWLDAARYGDTHGLHLDNLRTMWPYRDWVIGAFNRNMPFDQFVLEQLAGDMLPEPTLEQQIASGFNRCNVTSAEGGMIAAEYLSLYARDRVDTTSTVFMGLTLGCAQCHDHKYDPFTTKEYYQLYAFFNSIAEEASDRNIANPAPFIRVPSEAQQADLSAKDARISELREQVDAPMPEVDEAQAGWELKWHRELAERWLVLVPRTASATNGTQLTIQADDSVLAGGANPNKDSYEITASSAESSITAVRLEALVGAGNSGKVPGRAENQNFVLTHFSVEAYPTGHPEQAQPVEFTRAFASHSQDKYPVQNALDPSDGTGWAGLGHQGSRYAAFVAARPFGHAGGTTLRVRLAHHSQFPRHGIGRVRLSLTEDPALSRSELGTWQRLGPFVEQDGLASLTKNHGPENGVDLEASYGDAGLRWVAEAGYEDGKGQMFAGDVGAMYLFREIHCATDRVMRIGLGSDDGLRAWLNGELVHDLPAARSLTVDQDKVDLQLRKGRNELLLKVANYGGAFGFSFRRIEESSSGLPPAVAGALETPLESRSDAERSLLKRHYRTNHAPQWIAWNDELERVSQERTTLENSLPTTMVSRDLDQRRQAHILVRGQYDKPGDPVEPATPSALPPLPENAPANRLGLARWLTRDDHPLTARVTVNRIWQQFFGVGLVETSEDFGVQGQYPSHPQLLDWLATEFVESDWNVKGLISRIVNSDAYRRSSGMTAIGLETDPYNRLMWRGPRFRMDAEMVRDTALFVSGMLVERVGGPSVKPYQPSGVWKAVGYSGSNTVSYTQDSGEKLYRRSLYTFWKRTAPPPNMVAFDAPSREACTVRRARTNTPMQALVLLNDIQFVEAARGLAARILVECDGNEQERAAHGFKMLTSRQPTARELEIMLETLEQQRAAFEEHPEDARQLLQTGQHPMPEGFEVVELAAWTQLASLLLNLDETITRG